MNSGICIVSTTRAPAIQLQFFIEYHLELGVDRVYLYFDNAVDPLIYKYNEHPRVHCTVCDDSFYAKTNRNPADYINLRQVANACDALEQARLDGYKWIVHMDTDELLYSHNSLLSELENIDTDIVEFEIRESIATSMLQEDFFTTNTFKKPISKEEVSLLESSDLRHLLFEGEYLRGHSASKCAVRISDKVLELGLHKPNSEGLSQAVSDTVFLLHFDSLGFDEYKYKFDLKLDPIGFTTAMRPNRVLQIKEYEKARTKGEESLRGLFKKLYTCTEDQFNRLEKLGMAEKIRV